MNSARILLVANDTALIRFLSETVQAARGAFVEVVPRLENARAAAADADVALVIVHLRASDEIGDVARLREYLAECGSPGALLIVCDEYRTIQAKDALLFGAIDYLPRPLDRNRVAFLVEREVLRIMGLRNSRGTN
jgi:DNA-binding NtrC family response regulator